MGVSFGWNLAACGDTIYRNGLATDKIPPKEENPC